MEEPPTRPILHDDDVPFILSNDTQRVRAIPARPGPPYTLRAILVGAGWALALVILLGALLAAGIVAYFQTPGVILPGVRVGAIPLGGLSVSDAATRLSERWGGSSQLTLTVGDHSWSAAPSDFGLSFDAPATAARAADVGHNRPLPVAAVEMLNALTRGWPVAPVVRFDESQARHGLTKWATMINQQPTNATLKIDEGQLIAVPGADGYWLDVEGTVQAIGADPAAPLVTGNLPLVLHPVAPRAPDASLAIEQAARLIKKPLEIAAFDPITNDVTRFTAQPADIAGWLTVQSTEDGPQVVVDPERVGQYLDTLSGQLGQDRFIDVVQNAPILMAALKEGKDATLIVSHRPTHYAVQPGDTLLQIAWHTGMPAWRIAEANPSLDANVINAGDVLTIPPKDVLLPLPVVLNKRIVLSISQQKMWGYQDGAAKYEFVVSTGIDRSPTQPGVFQVQTHDLNAYASVWDLYMPHFLGIYEAWPGFMNGFHGLPLLHGGTRLWGDVLGRPASFGCIILSLADADTLYNWAEDGVVVEIRE